MASSLFAVFGKARLSITEECPSSLKETVIKLQTKDDTIIELPAEAACISLRIRDIALSSGAEGEIPLPLKKALVTKVVEYLNYHKDVVASDIQLPLESDSLTECGAQKWDATFVSVEKDALFDLALAANLLDIPSLTVLTGAKLMLMVKDKAADKLRKEFGYLSDMSDDEFEGLQSAFAMARARAGLGFDQADLAQATVMTMGLAVAAERHGVLEGARTDGGKLAVSVQSWRHACWRTAIMTEWNVLYTAPPEITGDRDLIEVAVKSSFGAALNCASDELKADKAIVLKAVSYTGSTLSSASDALRSDKAFVLEAIKVQGDALVGAAGDLQSDKDLVMEAAQLGQGSAMQGASPALLANQDLVESATKLDPSAFKYADESLRNDRDFALKIAGVCGAALLYMPAKFKADAEIVQAAVANDPSAALSAHASRRSDLNADAPWDFEKINKSVSLSMVTKTESSGIAVGKFLPQQNPVDPQYVYTFKCIKTVFMSGFGTILGTIGQANYLAANSLLDRIKWTDMPGNEYTTLMWGGVGGEVGMRFKAFGSQDALNAAPENLLTMYDARRILQMVTCCGAPEWTAGSASDQYSRAGMLQLTAGFGSGGGWKPGEDAHVPLDKQMTSWFAPKTTAKPSRTDPEPDTAKSKKATAEIGHGPLGGWSFARSLNQDADEKTHEALKIAEGARVMLTGLDLKRKNGATGTAVKQMSNGRWKVQMDDGSGFALLPDQCLKCLTFSAEAGAGDGFNGSKPEQSAQRQDEDKVNSEEPVNENGAATETKDLTVEGLLQRACPSWNKHVAHLVAGSLQKVGAYDVQMLKSMLEPDDLGDADVINKMLKEKSEPGLPEDTLEELRKLCASLQ